MDHLWSTSEPQTVRQVHEALAERRELAYTTVMTVLQRLAKKHLVIQQRDDRAHRYLPVHQREELVASLMVDALQQADKSGSRTLSGRHWLRSKPRNAPATATRREPFAPSDVRHA
jgi:predicted transcriptional regulator